jgi:hypothetical protein
MSERKVLNKYFDPYFNPEKLEKRKPPKRIFLKINLINYYYYENFLILIAENIIFFYLKLENNTTCV